MRYTYTFRDYDCIIGSTSAGAFVFLEFKADSYFSARRSTLWQTFESLFYVICIYACFVMRYIYVLCIDRFLRKTVLIIITLLFVINLIFFNRILAEVFSLQRSNIFIREIFFS